jgi:hypothetical protein
MKKLLVVLGLLLLVSAVSASAQVAQASYFVDYYSNNINPLAADQVIRAINVGTFGTPLTSIGTGQGDICENIYVFDNNQEMVACCACRLTPDELSSAAVGAQLTNHALTGTAPVAGVVKIAFTLPANYNGPTGCRAETAVLGGMVTYAGTNELGVAAQGSWAAVFGTHLQAEPPASTTALFVTETEKLPQYLSGYEAEFLPNACSFVRYLGSGTPGTCSCNAGGTAH